MSLFFQLKEFARSLEHARRETQRALNLLGAELGRLKQKIDAISTGTSSWDFKPYQVKDGTGDQSIGASAATVNLDTEVTSDAAYTLIDNTVQHNESGDYMYSHGINWDETDQAGATRANVIAWLEYSADSGDSWAEVDGSRPGSKDYHREYTGGSGLSSPFYFLKDVVKGTRVRLRAEQETYLSNIDTAADGVGLSILKIG